MSDYICGGTPTPADLVTVEQFREHVSAHDGKSISDCRFCAKRETCSAPPYGYCPSCGGPGIARARDMMGTTRCAKGHEWVPDSKASRAHQPRNATCQCQKPDDCTFEGGQSACPATFTPEPS